MTATDYSLLELNPFMDLLPAPSLATDQRSVDDGDYCEISERRQRAFRRAQNHSRNVFWMRRAFPVLAILSVGFYFLQGGFSVNYGDMKASVEKVELTRNELKMTNPRLEGHDEKAGSYLVTADTAVQKSATPHIVQLDKVDGKLEHPSNGSMTLTANDGVFDTKTEVMDLSGDIVIKSTNGMQARLEDANIIIKTQKISSDRPVYVEMNGSTIRADRIRIDGLAKTVDFVDRVKVRLIKSPKKAVVAETPQQ